jgi:AcrR family transcriptional regulator
MTTRRERARVATVAEIRAAALDQVRTHGAAELTIRGVARAIGMSPAGLYRYYDGRDALLTDLLADAYGDLADAVSTAAGWVPGDPASPAPEDPLHALLGAALGYRSWAVAQPARFLLIFGTPVPGYEAPEDGPTVVANARMGSVFLGLGALAWARGLLQDPPGSGDGSHPAAPGEASTPALAAALEQLHALAPDLPAGFVPRMLGGWALIHGLVTLEVTGQLHWAIADPAAAFEQRMRDWAEAFRLGVV